MTSQTPIWRHRQTFLILSCFVVKFSYWPKFYVNIITSSRVMGVMAIFLYKGLSRDLEIEITTLEFCPKSGDWGKLGIPNLSRMSLKKCYWMLQNATISFIIFWDFSMFYQIFLSAQVKRWAIITHELPNDLRLRILGN